jgi:carbon storage regulator
MLILGRRVGETLLIGDDIKVFVLHCDRTSVRIGIEAPSTVTILRGEIAPQHPIDGSAPAKAVAQGVAGEVTDVKTS